MTDTGDGTIVWKHIGLHGHSVGTFSCEKKGITWKSAVLGGDEENNHGVGTTRYLPKAAISGMTAKWTVFGKSGHLRVSTNSSKSTNNSEQTLKHEYRFDGFPPTDYDLLRQSLKDNCNIELQKHNMSSAGTQYGLCKIQQRNIVFRHCILEDADEEGEEYEPREGDEMMSLDLAEVSQCVLPGNNRNEIELQFPESDTIEAGTDQLVAIRLYIPPDPDVDPNDKTIPFPAEVLQQKIMQTANIRKTTGDVIVEFEQNKGTFLTPRGRYAIELYDWFLRMRGQKYDYKIRYDDINRLFLLPKPDEVHMAFVIALDKPIRQGQQRYQYLVLQATKDPDEVTVNLDEETLKKEYGGELQTHMRGSLSNLVAKTFKVIARKKVFIPGKFANANQQACVKCALRANEGLLYPLEKQFVFIHKPPVLIRFNEVESVEFQRYAGGQGSTRNFDLCVNLKATAGIAAGQKEYTFSGIDRSDYAGLYNFLSGKKIIIKNIQDDVLAGPAEPLTKVPIYNEDVIYGVDGGMDQSESEDDSYGEKDAINDAAGDSSADSEDDEDLDSDVVDDDSDLEEARKAAKKEKKQAAAAVAAASVPKKEDTAKKASNKREPPPKKDSTAKAQPTKKKAKTTKDPNAPKKARSAYLFYANSVRAQFQKDNPDSGFGDITKLVADSWKKLSDEERKKWDQQAADDKTRYKDEMEDYSAPEDSDDDSSPKKAKKDPNAPKKAMSSYMFFMNKNRARIKEDNPDATFGDLARKVAAEFKNLTPEEKAKYEKMAQEDKTRYKDAMKDYTPPTQEAGSKGKKATGKAKKDPDAPKRAMTSFMYFSNAMRSKVKEDNPDISFGEVGKELGRRFKELSAEEKAKYEAMAKKDKERYKKELSQYKAKSTAKKEESSSSDASSSDSDNDSDDGKKKNDSDDDSGDSDDNDSDDGSDDSDDDSD